RAPALLGGWSWGRRPLDALPPPRYAALSVVRHARLGLPGFDLVGPPAALGALHQRLVAAGAVGAGPEVFNVLRVEAGLPVDGIDIDAERVVGGGGRGPPAVRLTHGLLPRPGPGRDGPGR